MLVASAPSLGCTVNASVVPAGGISEIASVSDADGLTSSAPLPLAMVTPLSSIAAIATRMLVLTLASKRSEKRDSGGMVAPTGTSMLSLCPLSSDGVTFR